VLVVSLHINQTASTLTGPFAGQYVMEGFLNWKVSPVVRVTITRSIALGPAIAVGLYMSLPGNSAAGDILNEWYEGIFFLCVVHIKLRICFFLLTFFCSWSHLCLRLNILQSIQLPFALLPVLHFTSSTRLMGDFANKGWINVTCWALAALVIGQCPFFLVFFLV